jgi:hypothetical protein
MELTGLEDPPSVPIRASESSVMYLVGDASGASFGTTNWIQNEETFDADYGTLNKDVTKKRVVQFQRSRRSDHQS